MRVKAQPPDPPFLLHGEVETVESKGLWVNARNDNWAAWSLLLGIYGAYTGHYLLGHFICGFAPCLILFPLGSECVLQPSGSHTYSWLLVWLLFGLLLSITAVTTRTTDMHNRLVCGESIAPPDSLQRGTRVPLRRKLGLSPIMGGSSSF